MDIKSLIVTLMTLYYSETNLANKHASRLFLDMMSSYNKLVRPVQNSTDKVVVHVKLKLSQLLDIAEKTQIMTTNIWLKQRWEDINLRWNASDYGGVQVIYVPSDMLWIPDIVLYNNADGKYQGSLMNKASVYYNGTVVWEPPAIYKSMCPIEIEFFPFDTQDCEMKFASWTYDGFEVDLVHYDKVDVIQSLDENRRPQWEVMDGVDLSDFYPSAEFDIMEVPARRHVHFYNCCTAPYIDITYTIRLRRQTLFYTVNLVVPCVGLAFLCILVFYLPSACGEKVALSISILICLTMFFLLLVEIIPNTSLRIPLIGKYLLFTMVMVTLSIAVTVVQLNFHYRTPNTHHLSPLMKKLFLKILPKFLMMKRPTKEEVEKELKSKSASFKRKKISSHLEEFKRTLATAKATSQVKKKSQVPPDFIAALPSFDVKKFDPNSYDDLAPALAQLTASKRPQLSALPTYTQLPSSIISSLPVVGYSGQLPGSPLLPMRSVVPERRKPPLQTADSIIDEDAGEMHSAVRSVCFIADYLKRQNEDDEVKEDWQFIAHVLDRLLLWIFSIACLGGTLAILLNPKSSIFDRKRPIA